MPNFKEVPLPLNGIHLFTEAEKQPPGTTVEMVNCRTVDVTSERRRISQRPGLTLHNTAQLEAALPIMGMAGFTTPNKTIDYATLDDVSIGIEWQNENENGESAIDMDSDLYGNLYVIDGPTACSIYNPEGELVKTVSPTLESDQLGLGLVIADPVGGFIVGCGYVTGGGSVETEEAATVHRYRPDEDYEYTEAWKINPGGYAVDGTMLFGVLYLLVNIPNENRAVVQVWDSISTTNPAKRREWPVPYPGASLAVRDDGNVFVASLENANRGKIPENPAFSGQSVVWTPVDVDEYKARIWSWYDAADIGDLVGMSDGNEVVFWPDKSKNDRDLAVAGGPNVSGPIYREKGFGNKPSVEFRGTGGGYAAPVGTAGVNGLISGPNLSHFDKNKDDQRGIIPAYCLDESDITPPDKFSKFCLVMLLRPTLPAPSLGDEKIGIPISVGSSSADWAPSPLFKVGPWKLQVNFAQDTPWPGVGSGGAISLLTDGEGGPTGSGTKGHGNLYETQPGSGILVQDLYGGDFDNTLSCAIVSIYGCADHDVPVSGTSISSLFRVNGVPIDRWSMRRQLIDSTSPQGYTKKTQETGIGSGFWEDWIWVGAGDLPYQGDIVEMVCFHWQDDADAISAPKTLLFAGSDGLGIDGVTPPWDTRPAETHGTNTSTPGNGTTLEKIEAFIAHKYGVQHLLPDDTEWYEHPYWETPPTVVSKPTLQNLFGTHQLLTKWAPDGSFRWATADIGGTGYGVAVGKDGSIFSSGRATGGDANTVRRIIDLPAGNDYSILAADEAWGAALNEMPLAGSPMTREKLAVDEEGNLYVPRACEIGVNAFTMVVVTQDPSSPGSGFTTLLRTVDIQQSGDHVQALGTAFYPVRPDYKSDEAAVGNVEETMFIQLARSTIEFPGSNDVATPLRRIRLVSATKNSQVARTLRTVATMGDGTLRVFDNGSTVTTPTHLAQLSSGAPYYHMTVGFGKVFVTDGRTVVFYDPETDEVDLLRSNTYGTFNFRPAILEVWRGRLVGARFDDQPQNWFMAAVGDPFNHDTFPPVAVVTQAVTGSSPEGAGLVPDVITGFAPVSDDWAVIGCDSSLFQLSGDPMQGGQHDLISGEVGMAFGRAWCKDDRETLYFISSDGAIYSMRRGERPQSMTDDRIHSRTRSIDFERDYVRMTWDQNSLSFYVMIFAYQEVGVPETATEAFVFSRRDGAWMQDSYALGLRSITSINGDLPSDRRILLGGEDGFVRWINPASASDDGAAIYSHCLVGPLIPEATANEWLLDRLLAVMASELGEVQYEVLVGDTADRSSVVASGTFYPGRNQPHWIRQRGTAIWVRFTSASPEITWACESLQAELYAGGPARMLV